MSRVLTSNSHDNVSDEAWSVRTISISGGTRAAEFRDAVRQGDGGCVITGERLVSARGSWAGFRAAHIFPLAYQDHWIKENFRRWVSIHPSTGGSINSVQNGLLLDNTIHTLFDNYDVSINPDVCVPLLRSWVLDLYICFRIIIRLCARYG